MQPVSQRLLERTPQGVRPAVRTALRTVDGASRHRLVGLAAEIAFWTLLSLPALLLTAIAVAGAIGTGGDDDFQDQFVDRAAEISSVALTRDTIDSVVRPLVRGVMEGGGVGIASFAFLATVWTASRAVKVVLDTLTIAYDRPHVRPGWQDRLLGFGLTLGGLTAGVVLLPLLLAGPNFGDQLEAWLGTGTALADIWRVAYWPAVVVGVTLGLSALYHLGVPGKTPWWGDLPGAILATGGWLAGSAALRLYGTWILDSDSVYGPLAGPIVAMLWVWVTGFVVLLGAELNAQVAHQREDTSEGDGGGLSRSRPDRRGHRDEPREAR